MSASIAISSAALASSAAANSAAQAAKKTACVSYVQSYKSETATTVEMQEYAQCIRLLYPQPMPGSEIIVLKVAIILAFVGLAIGGYKGFKKRDGLGVVFLFAFLGSLVLPILAVIILTFIAGGIFLFSA